MAEHDMLDFRLLFESVPGLYMVLTPDLHIAAVSNEYMHATKTERSQIVGRHLFDRGRGKAMVEKRSAGGVEDRLAFYRVDRALRTRKGFA